MKKMIAVLLSLLMLLTLTACGEPADKPTNTTTEAVVNTTENVPEDTTAAAQDTTAATEAQDTGFVFTFKGVDLIPGQAFNAAAMPEASSVFQVPSCAIEGTDNVYNYEAFEVTAYNDGTGEVIYSIYIIDPNITTPEGLALGDSLDRVVELYGDGYVVSGTAYDYSSEGTMLSIIIQSDAVASIEYRMITE